MNTLMVRKIPNISTEVLLNQSCPKLRILQESFLFKISIHAPPAAPLRAVCHYVAYRRSRYRWGRARAGSVHTYPRNTLKPIP